MQFNKQFYFLGHHFSEGLIPYAFFINIRVSCIYFYPYNNLAIIDK